MDTQLVTEVVSRVLAASAPADQALVEAFVEEYVGDADALDLAGSGAADLAGAVVAHLELAARRPPGTAVVRIWNPTDEVDGWTSPHTVLAVVTDDIPFLVDSVVAAVSGQGLDVHLLAHPIARVVLDDAGRVVGPLHADGDAGPGSRIALLLLQIDRETGSAVLAALASTVRSVLDDVAAAVSAWAPMRAEARRLADDLRDAPPPTVVDEEAREAATFLDWLADDHFTFQGRCTYDMVHDATGTWLRLVPGSALGILEHRDLSVRSRTFDQLTDAQRELACEPYLLTLTKAHARSTVHRAVPLDYIGVKRFDAGGRVIGEHRFVGLYTAGAYNDRAAEIPVVRRKVAQVVARTHLAADTHDGRALVNVLETFPRDELFRLSVERLTEVALGILRLGPRRRVRAFAMPDDFGRFVSFLVQLPRERYTTAVRTAVVEVLRAAVDGTATDFHVLVDDSVLARLHVVVDTPHAGAEASTSSALPTTDPRLDADLARVVQGWTDELRNALIAGDGEERGLERFHRWVARLPLAYQDDVGVDAAVIDLAVLESLAPSGDLEIGVERGVDDPRAVRIKLYRTGEPLVLSDVVPLFEHLGVTVLDERPYEIGDGSAARSWIYSFGIRPDSASAFDDPDASGRVAELFLEVWAARIEDDGLNRLVLAAGLRAPDVVILRACSKYLHQCGVRFSEASVADALVANPRAAQLLVERFAARLDPSRVATDADLAESERELTAVVDGVATLDEDRILRALSAVVGAAVRTTAYLPLPDGEPRPLAMKLDPRALPFLPSPRPRHEIWVCSPRVEGVHLRGGDIARGGIRWSDRRDDFRTEVLGLMKAQTAKNAVIVPVGAKGGFVVKRPPTDAVALRTEVLECYRAFIGALLDLTDSRVGDTVVGPPGMVRRDGDDPYLVVAADKGTASFSDAANALAAEHDYWLDDAFASGGSSGYDHKAMGITARGAWVSVRAHFRTLGIDADTAPLTLVGIGDMSGDVFGNGLLRSPHVQLLAAFDHRHVFVDPAPDPARSFAERARLFALPGSTWADYDPAVLSAGGSVHSRAAKSVELSDAARAVLGIEAAVLTPDELVAAILRAPVDLLWNGGVGTFVRASTETDAEVGDRANDAVRVSADTLRCRVVAEGGNLGLTQRARVELALRGGLVNTDSIDNSAGVDCSDHEVNLKILLRPALADASLSRAERDELLAAMTEEVAQMVLADNEAQANALQIASVEAPGLIYVHDRQMERLERAGLVDRALERLPDAKGIDERHAAGRGLTAPELAVLLAFTKIELQQELVRSDVPDDPYVHGDLVAYFPTRIGVEHRALVARHPLRREITATVVANAVVNRAGISFLSRLADETGEGLPMLVRAHIVARDVFDIARSWSEIDALDLMVPVAVQDRMFLALRRLTERAARWFVRTGHDQLPLADTVARFRDPVARYRKSWGDLMGGRARERRATLIGELRSEGVPDALAVVVADAEDVLSALAVADLANRRGDDVLVIGAVDALVGEELGLDLLRELVAALPREDRWQTEARAALRDDVADGHRAVTAAVLATTAPELDATTRVATWTDAHEEAVARFRQVFDEVAVREHADLASLAVVRRQLQMLTS